MTVNLECSVPENRPPDTPYQFGRVGGTVLWHIKKSFSATLLVAEKDFQKNRDIAFSGGLFPLRNVLLLADCSGCVHTGYVATGECEAEGLTERYLEPVAGA